MGYVIWLPAIMSASCKHSCHPVASFSFMARDYDNSGTALFMMLDPETEGVGFKSSCSHIKAETI